MIESCSESFRAGLRRSYLIRMPVAGQSTSFREEHTDETYPYFLLVARLAVPRGKSKGLFKYAASNLFQVRGRYSWPAMANKGPHFGAEVLAHRSCKELAEVKLRAMGQANVNPCPLVVNRT